MKSRMMLLAAILLATLPAASALAQPRFSAHGFDEAGAFHMTISGAGDLEASTNLQTWTKFASVAQETRLDDIAARQTDWRFYRAHGGRSTGASNAMAIGYVKVTIAPGKTALLGNPFANSVPMESPQNRQDIFGSTNPAVKVSLYANGNFQAHTLDKNSGAWTPALRPIRGQEGFSVENTGTTPLTVRLSGQVRQGQLTVSLPKGPSLVVPPVPQPGSVFEVLGIPAKEGLQILFFNEETQSYVISTYEAADGAWAPKLPEYKPGRAMIVKSSEALTWNKSFSASRR